MLGNCNLKGNIYNDQDLSFVLNELTVVVEQESTLLITLFSLNGGGQLFLWISNVHFVLMSCWEGGSLCRDKNNKDIFIFSLDMCVCLCVCQSEECC